MRKIYKLCIGIALSAIIVACADKLDSDKYFKDRRSLEDVFILIKKIQKNGWRMLTPF